MNRLAKTTIGLIAAFGLSASTFSISAHAHEIVDCSVNCQAPKIQIALLLDTSNSMDGLISQAKSQLWMLVNELGETKKHGITPSIELALYEYGNSNISVSKGYIRQVTSLTTDLDGVSEKLFALKTRGGQEYAGQVIAAAIDQLEWSSDPADMKLVIIAGNEPFTQGPVPYQNACTMARRKGILIDTIHCGDERTGIDTEWKAGADCGAGIYMTINQDDEVAHVPSPYDDAILDLNRQLNGTYYAYGKNGADRKVRQSTQDRNAGRMGVSSEIARAVTKSSGQYSNTGWDVVDAYKSDKDAVLSMDDADLPAEMKGMDAPAREAFITQKTEERDRIAGQISALKEKRSNFVKEKRADMVKEKTLEQVVVSAVKSQAREKGFE